MTWKDVEARIGRLDGLARGLAAELSKVRKGKDPLYRNERLEYMEGLSRALTAAEQSRIVLSQAMRRWEEELAEGNPGPHP